MAVPQNVTIAIILIFFITILISMIWWKGSVCVKMMAVSMARSKQRNSQGGQANGKGKANGNGGGNGQAKPSPEEMLEVPVHLNPAPSSLNNA
ncbi:hypothetical protein F4777DRAFT_576185 [Nemania sp. FL0916]|nr:hypothetical protein F4777DRAFT_576185 [Nemania sp. FL0916]